MGTTSFLLIRHAESVWNAEGRWQGHGDPPLSDRGLDQARRLAGELATEPIDVLITSDLLRARETARPLATARHLVPETDPRLRELDVAAWTGLCRDEIERKDSQLLEEFENEDPEIRPGGGETRLELRERVRRAIAEWTEAHAGRRITLVTHLGVIRALTGQEIPNATWTRIER